MNRVFLILFFSIFSFTAFSNSSGDDFFSVAHNFFSKYVKNGLVDYSTIKYEPDLLNQLVEEIKSMDLTGASAAEKKAFYNNAYNISVIKLVVKHYPIAQPFDVDGFFDKIKHTVAGESLTLNEIENKKVREVYNDPRIHFSFVCAAKGCPKLASFSFIPDELDSQLDMRTKSALNDDDFIRVYEKQRKVLISKIFEWYKDDFKKYPSILTYINKYRKISIPEEYTVDYYEYDWNLNRQ